MRDLIDSLVAALDVVAEIKNGDEAIPNSDPRPYAASRAVDAAAAALLAARFPGRKITSDHAVIGFGGSTYFFVAACDGDEEIKIRLSDHANQSRQHMSAAANIIAGCDADDVEAELDEAAEEIARLEA